METQIKLAILLALSLSQHCPRHLKSGIPLIYNLCSGHSLFNPLLTASDISKISNRFL